MKFEERKEKFQEKLVSLLKEYNVDIYAANMTINNEVHPVIRVVDTDKVQEKQIVNEDGTINGEIVEEKKNEA